jgi:2-polyprenyl-3-methyl-5-hydroxy-6-metoxy-1,4-benzoquinol methylase
MTSMTDPGATPTYTLDNSWRAARQRLDGLEAACDPVTAAHLDAVGIAPGWHCIEIGAGGGSVVRMLCDRVGPEGRVLAVDLELALLEGLEAPNLEVRRMDVTAADDILPGAAFDLIHTRAVLMHIPQREEVIPRLVGMLRPGGVLLLEEMDMTDSFATPGHFSRTMQCMYRPIIEAGMALDLFWARRLPSLLEPAGLVDVSSTVDRMAFTGGEPLAHFYRVTFEQYLESQPYTDEERATIEAGRAALLDSDETCVAWDLVSAWGRRP